MARKYPHYSGAEPIKSTSDKSVCVFCKEGHADRLAEVQFSWFRTDDAYYFFHQKCLIALNVHDAHERGKMFLQAGLSMPRFESKSNKVKIWKPKRANQSANLPNIEPHIKAVINKRKTGQKYDEITYKALERKYPVLFKKAQDEKN